MIDEVDSMLDNAEVEFLRRLEIRGVHYVIIGGHAVYHYGYKRIVGDLDLIIDNSCTNIHKFLQVIEDINMKLNNGMRSKLCEPNIKVNIPLFNVHVLTSMDNFPFRELFDNKIIIIFEGLKVSMISRDHLLRMKRESTRAEDQHDYVKLLSIEEKT
jgi:predicted nucleotidyltransferase